MPARTATFTAANLLAMPPMLVALCVPRASFSMEASILRTAGTSFALGLPKFCTKPSAEVSNTNRSAGNNAATKAESLSLSPTVSSVKVTASFSLITGTTPRASNAINVLRALRWRS